MKPLPYIPEIDSLRAIAVLSVVIYHAAESLAPGGFIGVDIFFVISGFVISRRYLDTLLNGSEKISSFFIARIRRLAPSALLVLIISTLAAIILIKPADLLRFGNSLLAQPFYLQNFVFWVEGDYFSGAIKTPLLHTWSLAVEEQFYILFALTILLLRLRPRLMLGVFVFFLVTSLLVGLALEPRSPKTVFYMVPTRIWEFLLGILTYIATVRLRWRPDLKTANFISGAAALYLCVSALAFTKTAALPGLHSISAGLATAAFLFCSSHWSGHLHLGFRHRNVMNIGKSSYAFYLWHWPPLTFFFFHTGEKANNLEGFAIMILAYAAAHLTVKYVEMPVRHRQVLNGTSPLLKAMGSGSVIVILTGLLLVFSNGLLVRYPSEIRALLDAPNQRGNFRCAKSFVARNPGAELCPITKGDTTSRKFLLLGDSHADVVKEAMAEVAQISDISLYLSVRNCDLGSYGSFDFCSYDVLDDIIKQAQAKGITRVIAMSFWEPEKVSAEGLSNDLERLINAGFRVDVVETVPNHLNYNPLERADKFLNGSELDLSGISREEAEAQALLLRGHFDLALEQFSDKIHLWKPLEHLCNASECFYFEGGKALYLDSNHLTFKGASLLKPMFVDIFEH